MTMKTQNEKQDTALSRRSPAGAETDTPAELTPATPTTMSAPRTQFTLVQLTTAGNNLTRGLVTSAQQMLRLQVSMLHSVVAMGFILGEARRLHFGDFTKMFPKKQGDEIKPGMFACSRTTAHNYIRTADAIWQRAAAAGKAAELEQQVSAYIVDAQTFDAPQREIPVLHELVNTEWVSMHQVMVELGVIKPARHKALANEQPAEQPALPGLEEYCRQAWENTTTALGAFRSLMETDIPRLNLQQRHTLRDELKSMLAELDRMETAAPELA